MTCRTCKHLRIPLDNSGRRHPRKNVTYFCGFAVPLPTNLPASVTRYYSFHWPPAKKNMGPDEGEGCPSYEPLVAKPAPIEVQSPTPPSSEATVAKLMAAILFFGRQSFSHPPCKPENCVDRNRCKKWMCQRVRDALDENSASELLAAAEAVIGHTYSIKWTLIPALEKAGKKALAEETKSLEEKIRRLGRAIGRRDSDASETCTKGGE